MSAGATIESELSAGGTPHRRVQSRLLRVFVLQLALISAAAALGVLAAGYVAERVLVDRALEGEADYFWKHRTLDPDFPLPDTLNLGSWLSSRVDPDMPAGLEALPLGRQRLAIDGDERIVHVSERSGERLYLLFQDETVSWLAFWFGLVPLTLVLLVMYGLAWLAYALSKRAVSPLTRLAGAIETFDFAERDAAELDLGDLGSAPDSETRVLVDAIDHFIARGKRSIERERDFTRYASHELRTPLAVIAGSVSTLELAPLEGAPARAVARVRRTTRHMSELLAALLLLARDERTLPTDGEPVDVGALLDELVAELDHLGADGPASVPLHVDHRAPLHVDAPRATLSIVLGNLLRNARAYTVNGRVDVVVTADAVAVVDTGPGLDADARQRVFEPFYRVDAGASGRAGTGLGLAIARQTAENQGWRLTLDSAPGEGSTFRVAFADKATSGGATVMDAKTGGATAGGATAGGTAATKPARQEPAGAVASLSSGRADTQSPARSGSVPRRTDDRPSS